MGFLKNVLNKFSRSKGDDLSIEDYDDSSSTDYTSSPSPSLSFDLPLRSPRKTVVFDKDLKLSPAFSGVSVLVDAVALDLKSKGVSTIKPGEVIRAYSSDPETLENEPFSLSLTKEMRAKAILRLPEDATFENLWARFRVAFLSKFKQEKQLSFQSRVLPQVEESLREWAKEAKSFNFPGSAVSLGNKSTSKKDTHDLLALNELVLALEGADLETLSLGTSFFSKYMKYLYQRNFISSIQIEVRDKKIQNLFFLQVPEGRRDMWKKMLWEYGSYASDDAAVAAAGFFITKVPKPYTRDGITTMVDRNEILMGKISESLEVFILTSGYVSKPESNLPFEYESVSSNTQRTEAGQVFHYQKRGEEILCTRTYFYVYDQASLHPLLQLGSAILGNNDMSFHECLGGREAGRIGQVRNSIANGPNYSEGLETYKTFAQARSFFEGKWSRSDVAHAIYAGLSKNPETGTVAHEELFRPHNLSSLTLNMESVLEHNPFTRNYIGGWAYGSKPLNPADFMSANYYPLTHRWSMKKYLEDGVGICREPQETGFSILRKSFK